MGGIATAKKIAKKMKAKLRFKNDPGVEGITDEEDSDFEKHSDFYDDDSGSRNESEY